MSRTRQAGILRVTRKIHRYSGLVLFVFLLVLGITGVLLGWKKNSNGYLLAATEKGSTTDSKNWIPLDSIAGAARRYLAARPLTASPEQLPSPKQPASPGGKGSVEIDRIDVRPDKGIAKVLFVDSYDALQLDLGTGKVLKEEKRRGDFIEHIHDGSYVDKLMGWSTGLFKLVYTTVMGLSLVLFSLSGFWLWYGPKQMRTRKK